MKKSLFTLVLLFCTPVISTATLDTQVNVNWMKGKIVATGSASITINDGTPVEQFTGNRISLNSARMDAYNKALEKTTQALVKAILNLRIDSHHHMKDVLRNHEISRSRFMEVIENKLIYTEKPLGYYESQCSISLNLQDLIDVVPFLFPGDPFPTRMDNPISTDYTSLIIDARGLDIKPMVFPSVYDVRGLEIYGRNFIDIHAAAKYGMASYAYTEKEAMSLKRAGEHPYFTAAIKSLNECPVVSDNAARKILSSQKTIENLKKCHVIFIINRKG